MSNHKGSEGTVLVGANVVAEIKAWSLDESANIIDDTELADAWKTKQAGTKEWSGNLECFWDETDTTGQGALDVGAEVTLNMHPEGNVTGDTFYTGLAIITGINRSGGVDGMVEVSFNFEGNGALTESTVA